jgi:hypothetical protein
MAEHEIPDFEIPAPERRKALLHCISEVLKALAATLKHAHEHGLRSTTLDLKHVADLLGGAAAELEHLIREIDRHRYGVGEVRRPAVTAFSTADDRRETALAR